MADIKRRFSRMLDIPSEAVLDIPYAALSGNETITVENFGAILEYIPEDIKLKTSVGVIEIRGCSMDIRSMSDKCLTIDGKISAIEFSD